MLAVDAIRSGNEEINQNSLEKMARAPLLSMIESADATVTA
jgi:hypothetical protein